MGDLSDIEHFVVLMLENRSFDNMLGMLYPKSASFDGLSGNETNPSPQGGAIRVWNQPGGTDPATMTIPDPDPGERWLDMNEQIYGSPDVPVPPPSPAPMNGFVKNYLTQQHNAPGSFALKNIMHYFTPAQLPVLSALAGGFAVSDRWFASAPCQTWPNRFFVHAATAFGYENNYPYHYPVATTLFNLLIDALGQQSWRVYFDDIALTANLKNLRLFIANFRSFSYFSEDAAAGQLPQYTFIEPRYANPLDDLPANDEHPPHNVLLGEQLIADVYNAVRNGPLWPKTLLIITYDEHGGCYDHVAPPAAVPPGIDITRPFNFNRYGVRVPAVFISPWIKAGTVLRASGATPFDHTSIIATVRKRFNLSGPLTQRDAAAPTFDGALNLSAPTNNGPEVAPLPVRLTRERALASANAPPSEFQQSLVALAANLPDSIADLSAGILSSDGAPPNFSTQTEAAGYMRDRFVRLIAAAAR